MKRLTDKQRAFLRSNARYGPHARDIERLIDSLAEALRDREARLAAARATLREVEHERDFVVRCNDSIQDRVRKTLDVIGRKP